MKDKDAERQTNRLRRMLMMSLWSVPCDSTKAFFSSSISLDLAWMVSQILIIFRTGGIGSLSASHRRNHAGPSELRRGVNCRKTIISEEVATGLREMR